MIDIGLKAEKITTLSTCTINYLAVRGCVLNLIYSFRIRRKIIDIGLVKLEKNNNWVQLTCFQYFKIMPEGSSRTNNKMLQLESKKKVHKLLHLRLIKRGKKDNCVYIKM